MAWKLSGDFQRQPNGWSPRQKTLGQFGTTWRFQRKSINGFRGDQIRIKFDELHAGLPGQRVSDVMIGDEPEFAEELHQP